jgi:hypothetical protein
MSPKYKYFTSHNLIIIKKTERAGFEPAVPAKGTPVFETGSISHSDTSPTLHLTTSQLILSAKLLTNSRSLYIQQVDIARKLGSNRRQSCSQTEIIARRINAITTLPEVVLHPDPGFS